MRWAIATILVVATGTFATAHYHRRICLCMERIEQENAKANREVIATLRAYSTDRQFAQGQIDMTKQEIERLDKSYSSVRNDLRELQKAK